MLGTVIDDDGMVFRRGRGEGDSDVGFFEALGREIGALHMHVSIVIFIR